MSEMGPMWKGAQLEVVASARLLKVAPLNKSVQDTTGFHLLLRVGLNGCSASLR